MEQMKDPHVLLPQGVLPQVVLFGRPNVGKSALFNALTQSQAALVAPEPGVTRDWRRGYWQLDAHPVALIDTAGLDDTGGALAATLSTLTRQQAQQADVIVFVLDGKDGVLPVDALFAQELYKLAKPVIVVVNKADVKQAEQVALEAQALGFGDPVLVSAAHQQGVATLAEAVAQLLSSRVATEWPHLANAAELPPTAATSSTDATATAPIQVEPIRIALVGRPNAGKSTLLNRLLGAERALTGPDAGLTREPILGMFAWQGQDFMVVDTPGQRKRTKVATELETASVATAQVEIAAADVVILVVDALTFPFADPMWDLADQDATLANAVLQAGKTLIMGLNKWDEVAKAQLIPAREAEAVIQQKFRQLGGVPVVCFSALTGKGVDRLLNSLTTAQAQTISQFGTATLNRWLERTQAQNPPPLSKGQVIKLKYMTQTGVQPLSFRVFGNRLGALPQSYKRYLVNQFRAAFDLGGIPVQFYYQQPRNPYATRRRAQ